MSRVSDRFNFRDEEDIIWTICFLFGLCIVGLTILFFVLIIQHIHAIPKSWSAADLHAKPKSRYVRKNATLSITFATLCVILTFSIYPVCTQWLCEFQGLGNAFYIVHFDSYILSKLFLYLLFIGHLFDPNYRRINIYRYSKSIQYLFYMLLIVMVITMIVSNMGSALSFTKVGLSEVVDVYSGMFIVADCIVSISTLVLLSYPICCAQNVSNQSVLEIPSQRSIVMKYCIISAVQLSVSTVWRITFVIRIFTKWFLTDNVAGHSFWHICSFIQMVDCFILILCIYFGFGRRQTVCIWIHSLNPLTESLH